MANSNQLTLEVLIKSIADAKGIVVTTQEVEKLAASMIAATGAGETLNTSVGAVTEGLQRQKTVAESASTDWEKLTEAQKSAHREAAQVALKQIDAAAATAATAATTATLSKNLGTLKAVGAGASQVIGGIANGNLPQMGQGFASIAKAVNDASPALQKFFAQVGRGAAIGANVAGPALTAITIANEKAKENQETMDRWFKEVAESSTKYTAMMEEHAARRAKALALELKAVQELATAYEESRARTDKAYGRDEQLDPAKKKLRDEQLNTEEKKELAGARTEEQRKRIKAKYDLKRRSNSGQDDIDDFDRADARADIEKQKAEEALNNANQKAREADNAVGDAQRAFDLALQGTRAFKPTDNSAAAQAARDKARAAEVNLKKTKEDRDTILGETSKIAASAQEEIDAANLVKEETALRRAAFEAMAKGRVSDAEAPDLAGQKEAEEKGGTVADLERRIQEEKDRAFRSTKHGDKADIAGLVKELEAARKAQGETYKAISDDAKKRKADADLAKRQIKNTAGGTNL